MDSSKSCGFVTVKYALIAILLINFVNLMVALSSGMSETDKNKNNDKEQLTTKKILETVRLVTTLISVIFGLVGVSRESFCLSLTTGIFMTLETVASFFGDFDAPNILSMVFNALIAVTTFGFAFMCKAGMNVFNTAQIEPIMVARNRTASKCPSVVVNFTDEKPAPPATGTTSEGSSLALPQVEEVAPEEPPEVMVIPEEPRQIMSIQEELHPVMRMDEETSQVLDIEEPQVVNMEAEPSPIVIMNKEPATSLKEIIVEKNKNEEEKTDDKKGEDQSASN